MKKYNFDEIIDRKGTDCIKYDATEKFWRIKDAFPMWVADMDFKTPDFIINALKKRLEHEILGYSFKSERHFTSIKNWLKKRHDFNVNLDEISSSPGVVTGFSMAIQQFTNPGDEIIVQTPVYFPFFKTIEKAGRIPVYNPLKISEGKITMDFVDLENKITSKTQMILLCNPHNPGGRVWAKNELKKLDEIARKHNLLVVSDEIHADILLNGNKFHSYASVSEYAAQNSIIFGAPSKTFNMAGLSTSYVIAKNPEILEKYNEILELNHLVKGNLLGNIALTAAYENGDEWLDQLIEYLEENLNLITNFFQENMPEVNVYRPDASFLVWLDFNQWGLSPAELKNFFFKQAKIIINPGYIFGSGGEGFMRLNFALPRKKLEWALEKIYETFKQFKAHSPV